MTLLPMKVATVVAETELIRRVVLEPLSGTLPGFDPGAYVTVHVPGVGRRRYSLVNTRADAGATLAPKAYELAVRLDAQGGGGSRFVHALRPGDTVAIEPPQNDFALTGGVAPVLLVAGGIGVTPLVSKAAAMRAAGRPFRLVYAARRRSDIAYLRELKDVAGDVLTLHVDEEQGGVLDIPGLFAALPGDWAVHVCGPRPMLSAALEAARTLGWPQDRLRYERFFSLGEVAGVDPAPAEPAGDGSFEVEIASTGQVVVVPADKTIVAALVDAGLDPLHDCMKGECGVCQVGVLEGIPDHRDTLLSDSERAAGKLMQICISRAKSPRLKLDL